MNEEGRQNKSPWMMTAQLQMLTGIRMQATPTQLAGWFPLCPTFGSCIAAVLFGERRCVRV